MNVRLRFQTALLLSASVALSGCLVGPNYSRPPAPTTTSFKEAEGWAPAKPSDAADRKDWWTVFNDRTLNALEERVDVSNQNLIAAEAAYRQAVQLVRADRASLFPTVAANGSVNYSGGGSGGGGTITTSSGSIVGGGGGNATQYRLGIGASWAPDLWGQIRRTIEAAKATAQASAGEVASARLSAQTELALDYIQLRQDDEQKRLLDATNAAYARTLQITQNKYAAGVSAKSDVLQARSLLLSTQAESTDLIQQRARLEHAIAILDGEAPAALSLVGAQRWTLIAPEIPSSEPSTLLQRRPDISTAERQVAAANAQIGVQVAAYYPNITLSGSGDLAASQLGQLFNASSFLWSVGSSAAETLIDFGARHARVAQARAAYDQAVANYRQTVLTAFGAVEDNLAAQRVLGQEEALRRQASLDADQAEEIARNQYTAGQVDFTTVVTSETNALNARTTLLQVQSTRIATAVDLISALGGGWRTSDLPTTF